VSTTNLVLLLVVLLIAFGSVVAPALQVGEFTFASTTSH
jgi:uncharacterized membrane protein YdfJ with MMPL/SSD domain